MICVRAPKLETRLEALTKATGKTKSSFVRAALEIFLPEQENGNSSHKSNQKKTTDLLLKEILKKRKYQSLSRSQR